jgi:hypothetical protein
MTDENSVFQRLRARGEEVFTQISGELMANPHFVKALQGAMRGKEKLDEAASRALKTMNVPTRTEFKKALRRIESLEAEIAALKSPAPRGRAPRQRQTRKAR